MLVNAALLVSLKLPLQLVVVPGFVLLALLPGILHGRLRVKMNLLLQPFHFVLVVLVSGNPKLLEGLQLHSPLKEFLQSVEEPQSESGIPTRCKGRTIVTANCTDLK